MTNARVNTSMPEHLKKQLMLQNINISEALLVGAKFLVNYNSNEKGEIMREIDKIKEEIKLLSNKLNFLEKQLDDLSKNKKKEIKDSDIAKREMGEKIIQGIKANNPLRDL